MIFFGFSKRKKIGIQSNWTRTSLNRPSPHFKFTHSIDVNLIRLPAPIKACPHWFPKQDTLYLETGDFAARNGNKVSCFRNQCGQAIREFWEPVYIRDPTSIRWFATLM